MGRKALKFDTLRISAREKEGLRRRTWKMKTKYCERNNYAWKDVEKVRSQGKQIWLYRRNFDVKKQKGRADIRNF